MCFYEIKELVQKIKKNYKEKKFKSKKKKKIKKKEKKKITLYRCPLFFLMYPYLTLTSSSEVSELIPLSIKSSFSRSSCLGITLLGLFGSS